jgi:hypothetical protein
VSLGSGKQRLILPFQFTEHGYDSGLTTPAMIAFIFLMTIIVAVTAGLSIACWVEGAGKY